MKIYINAFRAAALSLVCANISFAADVAAPQKRVEVTELAERLINPPVRPVLTVVYNPFTLGGARAADLAVQDAAVPAAGPAAPGNDRQLVEKLAGRIEPSGTVVMGGEAILLLGQNRLKVGDLHSINFEGATYEVEITSIESTRFSIRYKNEELTRPIVITKSGK